MLNFARAFQHAGARSVMVTLWNIPVDESLQFYTTFYKALREGQTKLQAMQAARQAIRAKEPHPISGRVSPSTARADQDTDSGTGRPFAK